MRYQLGKFRQATLFVIIIIHQPSQNTYHAYHIYQTSCMHRTVNEFSIIIYLFHSEIHRYFKKLSFIRIKNILKTAFTSIYDFCYKVGVILVSQGIVKFKIAFSNHNLIFSHNLSFAIKQTFIENIRLQAVNSIIDIAIIQNLLSQRKNFIIIDFIHDGTLSKHL